MLVTVKRLAKLLVVSLFWLSLAQMIGCGNEGKSKHKRKKKDPAVDTEGNPALTNGQKADEVSRNKAASKSTMLRHYEESNGYVTKSYVLLAALPKDKECRIVNTLFSSTKGAKLQPVANSLPASTTFRSGTIGDDDIAELADIIETADDNSRAILEDLRGSVYVLIEKASAQMAKDPVAFALDLRCQDRKHVRVPFSDFSKPEVPANHNNF